VGAIGSGGVAEYGGGGGGGARVVEEMSSRSFDDDGTRAVANVSVSIE